MHIVALASHPSSNRGGQELSLLEVCRNLHQNGHRITLLHSHEGDLLDQYRTFCKNVVAVKAYKILRKTHALSFLRDLIKTYRLQGDIIYSNQYHDCFMGAALAFWQRVPLLCHLRTPAPEELATNDLQLRLGLRTVSRFIAVSSATQQGWVALGFPAEKFTVVHNGTDTVRFQPAADIAILRQSWNIPLAAQIVAYVGRLDIVKGLESLIQAFALIAQQNANAILLIAGRPAYQNSAYTDQLKQFTQKLGIGDRVRFLGYLADTVPVYQLSDVTVLPSIYAEPFARSAVESMACGTPVIMSNIGGTVELLRGQFHQWLFEPGNSAALVAALESVLAWRKTQPELGELCRSHILEKFSIQHAVKQIEQAMLREIV